MIARTGELEEIHDSADAAEAVKSWLNRTHGEGYVLEQCHVTKQAGGWYVEYRNPPGGERRVENPDPLLREPEVV